MDYSFITNKILKGWAVRARGPIPQSFFGHNSGLYMYDYNMQKAREYLAKSKYPDGFRIITAYNKENETRKQIVLHIKEQLAKLNIEVEVLEFDNPTYIKKLRAGEFPIYVQGWCPDFADPDDYIFHFFHSKGHLHNIRKGWYSDSDMDKLVESAQRELDPVRRKELYFEIQKKIMDEYLFVWTHFAKNYVIHRNTIKNIIYNNMFDGFWYYTMVKI